MSFDAGDAFAGYRIIERVGAGGMATVYKAYQQRLDRHVAIKVLHETFAQDDSFLERFEREARIVARLEHPHIVPIYDYAKDQDQPYFVMKFIEGGTLKRRLIKRGLGIEEILRMMNALADALTYAHEKGVLHRDIKPSNILIDQRDLPYISDFGLARIAQVGDSTISHDLMIGTPFYISPEQARGERQLGPATDVYSFGVILYELLTSQLPFSAETPYAIVHKHIYAAPAPPSQINSGLTEDVDRALLCALDKSPERRFSSATDLMAALSAALAPGAIPAWPVQPATDDWREPLAEDVRFEDGERKNDASATPEDEIRRRIKKKIKARSELMQHLAIFLGVNLLLWSIWLFTRTPFPWPLFATAAWGIGIVSQLVEYHYKHGRGARDAEAEVESQIAREVAAESAGKAKRRSRLADEPEHRPLRLTDDGELSDSFVDEIKSGRSRRS